MTKLKLRKDLFMKHVELRRMQKTFMALTNDELARLYAKEMRKVAESIYDLERQINVRKWRESY